MTAPEWFFPAGSLARDSWPTAASWGYTGLRIGHAGTWQLPADGIERMIVPLDARNTTVEHGGGTVELAGRASVFDGPADVAYLGTGTAATVRADGRFAVAEAPADRSLPIAVIRAADVPVELRGAGQSTRQVHNFGTPGSLAAQNLIVCEVITPTGNWSSYPPHKHDESVAAHESALEEIYYFEAAVERGSRPDEADPFGLFAAYSSPGHPISIDERVHSGDVAVVPHGYHGPAVAAPGYDLYYLNVMAGPGGEREWLITVDPDHRWVTSAWEGQTQDERLPFRRGETR
jgi:5-deoxy-glucuronate isomerase